MSNIQYFYPNMEVCMSLYVFHQNYTLSSCGLTGLENCAPIFPQTDPQNCIKMMNVWNDLKESLPYPTQSCEGDECRFRTSILDFAYIKENYLRRDGEACSVKLSSIDTNRTIADYHIDDQVHTFSLKSVDSFSDEDTVHADTDFKSFVAVHWDASWNRGELHFEVDPKDPMLIHFVYENDNGKISGNCLSEGSKVMCAYIPKMNRGVLGVINDLFFQTHKLEASLHTEVSTTGKRTYKINLDYHSRYFTITNRFIGSFSVSIDPFGSFEVDGAVTTEAAHVLAWNKPRRYDRFHCTVANSGIQCNASHRYKFKGAFAVHYEESNAALVITPARVEANIMIKTSMHYRDLFSSDIVPVLQQHQTGVLCDIVHKPLQSDQNCQLSAQVKDNIQIRSKSRGFHVRQRAPNGTAVVKEIESAGGDRAQQWSIRDMPYLLRNANIIQQIGLLVAKFLG